MGAFNAWVAGSFLEPIENRTVSEIGLNLLYGAAALTRAQQLRAAGFQRAAATVFLCATRIEIRQRAYQPAEGARA